MVVLLYGYAQPLAPEGETPLDHRSVSFRFLKALSWIVIHMKNIPVRSIKPEQTKPPLPLSFRIRTIAEVLDGRDMNQDLHRHDFYFLLALRRGQGTHEIDFVSHPIENDTVFFMRPGQVHRLSLKAKSEGYLVEFGKDFLSQQGDNNLIRKCVRDNYCKLAPADSEEVQNVLKTIHEEQRSQAEGFRRVIMASLSILFIKLVRAMEGHHLRSAGKRYAHNQLEEFMELLEAEFGEYKQASYYAARMSLSMFQLNSVTKSLAGKTAAQLIDDHILLEAKRYLLATTNQVSQIAYQLGYEDVSYFIRFFRKHTGSTPEAFRQNFR